MAICPDCPFDCPFDCPPLPVADDPSWVETRVAPEDTPFDDRYAHEFDYPGPE